MACVDLPRAETLFFWPGVVYHAAHANNHSTYIYRATGANPLLSLCGADFWKFAHASRDDFMEGDKKGYE